jgi:hypothetical protein
MEGLVQPDRLRTRILMWAEEGARLGALHEKSGVILEAVLFRGELPRGDVDALLGTSERHGRRIVSALVERGVLDSNGSRAPLRLAFPAALASRWMPGLFPSARSDRQPVHDRRAACQRPASTSSLDSSPMQRLPAPAG